MCVFCTVGSNVSFIIKKNKHVQHKAALVLVVCWVLICTRITGAFLVIVYMVRFSPVSGLCDVTKGTDTPLR